MVLQLKFFVQYKLERHWNTIIIWISPLDNYMNTKKRIQSNRIKLVFMMITFLSILIINHKCFLLIQTTKWSVLIVVKTITDNKTMWYGTFKYTLPIWMIFILAQFVRHQQKNVTIFHLFPLLFCVLSFLFLSCFLHMLFFMSSHKVY